MTFGLHEHRHPHWEAQSGFSQQVLVTASTVVLHFCSSYCPGQASEPHGRQPRRTPAGIARVQPAIR